MTLDERKSDLLNKTSGHFFLWGKFGALELDNERNISNMKKEENSRSITSKTPRPMRTVDWLVNEWIFDGQSGRQQASENNNAKSQNVLTT